MKLVVVGMPNEESFAFNSAQEMIDAAPQRGWTFTGTNDHSQSRPLLMGMPKFKGLAGPFGNGDDVRYETWPAYKLYSS
jgi:hypothetical protein